MAESPTVAFIIKAENYDLPEIVQGYSVTEDGTIRNAEIELLMLVKSLRAQLKRGPDVRHPQTYGNVYYDAPIYVMDPIGSRPHRQEFIDGLIERYGITWVTDDVQVPDGFSADDGKVLACAHVEQNVSSEDVLVYLDTDNIMLDGLHFELIVKRIMDSPFDISIKRHRKYAKQVTHTKSDSLPHLAAKLADRPDKYSTNMMVVKRDRGIFKKWLDTYVEATELVDSLHPAHSSMEEFAMTLLIDGEEMRVVDHVYYDMYQGAVPNKLFKEFEQWIHEYKPLFNYKSLERGWRMLYRNAGTDIPQNGPLRSLYISSPRQFHLVMRPCFKIKQKKLNEKRTDDMQRVMSIIITGVINGQHKVDVEGYKRINDERDRMGLEPYVPVITNYGTKHGGADGE